MTAGIFAWFSEEMITNLAQIAETNSPWVSFHIRCYIINVRHVMYSTIIDINVKG